MGRHRNFGGGSALPVFTPPPEQDAMLQSRVVLTSAEILNLAAAPKTLLNAPGPGKIIQPFGVTATIDFKSQVYLGTALWWLTMNGLANGWTCSIGMGDALRLAVRSTFMFDAFSQIGNGDLTSDLSNTPLMLENPDPDYTGGDSPIIIQIYYSVGSL